MVYACRLHARQYRKGSRIPYFSHLLAVASLVLEHGGGEDEAIAALLHDAVEDQGGTPILAEIEARFGAPVASIVQGCTDAVTIPKPPWRERKERYIARLAHEPPQVRLVSAADKLHNARSIVSDYRCLGEALWDRFHGGRDGTLWYYQAVSTVLVDRGPAALALELARVVQEMERLANPERSPPDFS